VGRIGLKSWPAPSARASTFRPSTMWKPSSPPVFKRVRRRVLRRSSMLSAPPSRVSTSPGTIPLDVANQKSQKKACLPGRAPDRSTNSADGVERYQAVWPQVACPPWKRLRESPPMAPSRSGVIHVSSERRGLRVREAGWKVSRGLVLNPSCPCPCFGR